MSDDNYVNSLRKFNDERRKYYARRLRRLKFDRLLFIVGMLGFGGGYALCVNFSLENHFNYWLRFLIAAFGGFFIGNISGDFLWKENEYIEKIKSKLNYCVRCGGNGYIDTFELLDPTRKTVINCNVCKPPQ